MIDQLIDDVILARRLRVKAAWLRSEAAAGRLPHVCAGDRYLFDAGLVRRLLLERARGVEHISPAQAQDIHRANLRRQAPTPLDRDVELAEQALEARVTELLGADPEGDAQPDAGAGVPGPWPGFQLWPADAAKLASDEEYQQLLARRNALMGQQDAARRSGASTARGGGHDR